MPIIAGPLILPEATVDGWVHIEGGQVVDWGQDEEPSQSPDQMGWITPPPVNAHTHVADAFLRGQQGMPTSIPELVGPGGWKHRQLAMARRPRTASGVVRYTTEMADIGTSHFIDFREGGIHGAEFLRDLRDGADWLTMEQVAQPPVEGIIFGRPNLHDFDPDEAEDLLEIVDGVGMSGMRDFPERQDLDAWVEAAHAAGKPWAVHVSEDRHDTLEDVMALEPDHVVHMVHASPREFSMAADVGLPIVACPRSNAFFGSKTPAQAMLDTGCLIAFGTDNGMLQDGDLRKEAALFRQYAPDVSDEQLLRMMTHNGRMVAGLPDWTPDEGIPVVWPEAPFDSILA